MDGDKQLGGLVALPQKPHLGRADGIAVKRDGTGKLPLFAGAEARDPQAVDLVHLAPGVGQTVGQIPVVGHQKQALGELIEPAHGIEPGAVRRQKLRDVLPALLVFERGDVAAWLIEHQGQRPVHAGQRLALHQNGLAVRVGPVAEVRGLAVDQDKAASDQLLGLAAGA